MNQTSSMPPNREDFEVKVMAHHYDRETHTLAFWDPNEAEFVNGQFRALPKVEVRNFVCTYDPDIRAIARGEVPAARICLRVTRTYPPQHPHPINNQRQRRRLQRRGR